MTAMITRCREEPERTRMPRKPNYRFERNQRAKSKAAKKAERLEAKARKSADKKAEDTDSAEDGNEE